MEYGFIKEFQMENLLREFISYRKILQNRGIVMNKEEFLNYIIDFAMDAE